MSRAFGDRLDKVRQLAAETIEAEAAQLLNLEKVAEILAGAAAKGQRRAVIRPGRPMVIQGTKAARELEAELERRKIRHQWASKLQGDEQTSELVIEF